MAPLRNGERLFYGWYVAVAGGLVAFVAWGIGFYQLGVFLNVFHEEYGWSLTALSLSAALFSVVIGTTSLFMGPVVDRHGPRIVMVLGGVILSLGMLGFGQAHALWQVYLAVAVLAVGFTCTSTLTIGAIISRWFSRRRAFVMTLTLMGAPFGALLLVPLSTWLLIRYGISTSSLVLAALALLITLPAALAIIRDDPANSGWQPDGERQPRHAPAHEGSAPEWTLRAAGRAPVWWMLTLSFTCILFGQVAFLVHQVNFLRPIVGRGDAALLVSVTGACGLLSRLFGGLGDRFPKQLLLAGYCALQVVAFLLAAYSSHIVLLAIASAFVGLAMGNVVALQPVLMAEQFGLRSYGVVFGAASLLTQFGAAAGMLLVGFLADRTGSYTLSFTVSAALAMVAAALAVISGNHAVVAPQSIDSACLESA